MGVASTIIETPTASGVNIEDAGASFARHLRAANLSARTLDTYTESVRQLAAFLHDQGTPEDVAYITREHVETFIMHLLERWKPATAHNRYRGLQSFFKWCVEEGEIKESPMANMKPPKLPEYEPPVLNDDALRRLLASVEADKSFEGRRDHAILRAFIDTGARRAEIAALRYDSEDGEHNDVDLDGRVLRVMGKGRRERIVPLTDKGVKAIDRYLRVRGTHRAAGTPWLWLSRKGRMTDSGIAQMIDRRGQEAGLGPIHPHQLRHSFADRQLRQGMQESDLMRITGWRSREMVRRYAASTGAERARESYWRLARQNDL